MGIETSCDDTGVGVLAFDPRDPLGSAVVVGHALAAQHSLHAPFSGIVPHYAAAAHTANLPSVWADAMQQAAAAGSFGRPLAVGVTSGPGMGACLRAGLKYGTARAEELGVPLLGVNHLEAHLLSPRLSVGPAALPFPYLVLLVSGGHTQIVLAEALGRYTLLADTLDDAVGEAFDKVGGLLCVGLHAAGWTGGAPSPPLTLDQLDATVTPPAGLALTRAAATSAAADAATGARPPLDPRSPDTAGRRSKRSLRARSRRFPTCPPHSHAPPALAAPRFPSPD